MTILPKINSNTSTIWTEINTDFVLIVSLYSESRMLFLIIKNLNFQTIYIKLFSHTACAYIAGNNIKLHYLFWQTVASETLPQFNGTYIIILPQYIHRTLFFQLATYEYLLVYLFFNLHETVLQFSKFHLLWELLFL